MARKQKKVVADKTIIKTVDRELIKIDLGCGPNKKEGFLGVDQYSFPNIDVVADLTTTWPWEDGSVSEANASHFVEHLDVKERCHFVNELYRVLAPGGKAFIVTPHWASCRAYGDPTHCFVEDTEILTEQGWKSIKDVVLGEKVLVLDKETGKTKYSSVINTISMPYSGEILSFQTECMDLKVTPNHDLLWLSKNPDSSIVYKEPASTFLSLSKSNHHPRRGIANIPTWEGIEYSSVRIAPDEKVTGHFIRGEFDAEQLFTLLGWYLAEGNTDLYDGHYRIDISQDREVNSQKYTEIRDLLQSMNFTVQEKPDGITFNSKSLALYFKKLGLSHQKYIPQLFKMGSERLLRKLIGSALKSDGRKNGTTGHEYATTSKQLADDFNEICIKAGYRSSIRVENRVGTPVSINPKYVAKHDMYFVSVYEPHQLWYPHPEVVRYDGDVVCVTVAEFNNIFVRRNGKPIWAGNCWPAISEFWFYYLSKEWRMGNAPHTDKQWLEWGFNCDFEATWGYSLHPEVVLKNQEYQAFSMQFYKEACQDTICTLISRKV